MNRSFSLITAVLTTSSAFADTLHVPVDFLTIQAAKISTLAVAAVVATTMDQAVGSSTDTSDSTFSSNTATTGSGEAGPSKTAVAVVSLLARPAADEAPTEAAETAGDPVYYTGAAAASCTHPLFVGLKYAAGVGPTSVAIGDLDGVNGPDLAVANRDSDDVSVLLNQGDGIFAPAVAYAAGNFPASVAIGDLDGVNGIDVARTRYARQGGRP